MADSGKILKTERNVLLAKVLFILTFFLPYLIVTIDDEVLQSFAFYSPTWIIGVQQGELLGGFSPVMLALFYFWIPYPIIGYFSLNYSKGNYSNRSAFLTRLLFVTLIASVMAIPLNVFNSPNSMYLPFPITAILAFLMTPFLKPISTQTPWEEKSSNEQEAFEK